MSLRHLHLHLRGCHARPTLTRSSFSATRAFSHRPLAEEQTSGNDCVAVSPTNIVYRGPLTPTFKRLKMFSLSSLGLSFSMTPFMFIVESNLPMSARAVLAFTAISTTSISTGLLAWASSPYVTSALLSKLPTTGAVQEMEVKTLTLWFKPRTTRIFDPTFLVGTNRPFANLELAQLVFLPPALRNTTPGHEETVAETTDEKGEVIGRWVVKWAEGGEGSCHEVGKVIRHFNVHKELLPPLVLVDAPADGVATKP